GGADLLQAFSAEFDAGRVLYALNMLHRRGVLVSHDCDTSAPAAAFWSPEGLEGGGLSRLNAAGVALRVSGLIEAPALEQALRGAGISLAGDLMLHVTHDYLAPAFVSGLRAAQREGAVVLPAKISGNSAWLGPLLKPQGIGPCDACLAHALAQ